MPHDRLKIDCLLFINLDFRTDRLDHMRQTLLTCPWPIHRIAALRLQSESEAPGEQAISLGVLSIWKSHRKALVQALDLVDKGSLVLAQDDVEIKPEFFRKGPGLPANLGSDWEVLLFTPRYRKFVVVDGVSVKQKWEQRPFGSGAVYLPPIRETYVCNGAHFCVFKNRNVIEKVIHTMDAVEIKYNFDDFLGRSFETYGIHSGSISVGKFGSDHHIMPPAPPPLAGVPPAQPAPQPADRPSEERR